MNGKSGKCLRLVSRCLMLLTVGLLSPSIHSSSPLTPYSTQELEELEKEFVQQINQSESIERNPLASQYINHIGKRLAKFAKIPTPIFLLLNRTRSTPLQVLEGILASTHS